MSRRTPHRRASRFFLIERASGQRRGQLTLPQRKWATEAVWRASGEAGRVLKRAGWASEPVLRAADGAGWASEPACGPKSQLGGPQSQLEGPRR